MSGKLNESSEPWQKMWSGCVREAHSDDLTALSRFFGRQITKLTGNALIALDMNGAIIGALSYSRIYSTWTNRSVAVNSATVAEDEVLNRLLVALAKIALAENCSRIDTQTSDQQLVRCLSKLGAQNLTNLEQWHLYELDNLNDFISSLERLANFEEINKSLLT